MTSPRPAPDAPVLRVVLGALVLPPMVLLTLVVAVAIGRPVVYATTYAGPDGRPFRLLRFRTLRETAHDPVLPPLGRLLRVTRLDHFPVLLNVVRGDLVLVGPSPRRLGPDPGPVGPAAGRAGVTGLLAAHSDDAALDTLSTQLLGRRLRLWLLLWSFIAWYRSERDR